TLRSFASLLIAGSEAAVNHRLKQNIHAPARNDRAPKFGKTFANCRPCHVWTPAAIAAKMFDLQANSDIMRATFPVF
ncbi:MAG: hypothetical protein ACREXY_15260, partial [Gammaproteobacteria bacterium]